MSQMLNSGSQLVSGNIFSVSNGTDSVAIDPTGTISISSPTITIDSSSANSYTSSAVNSCINVTSYDEKYLKVKHSDSDVVCDELDCVIYTEYSGDNIVVQIHNISINIACLMCEKFKKINMKEKLMIDTAKTELKKI